MKIYIRVFNKKCFSAVFCTPGTMLRNSGSPDWLDSFIEYFNQLLSLNSMFL